MLHGKLNESLIETLQPQQILMYKKLIIDYGIDESVAIFACMQTNFRDLDSALDYLFEPFEHTGSRKLIMPHPFTGYNHNLPNTFSSHNAVNHADSEDPKTMICFLCQGAASLHLMPEDMAKARAKREKDKVDAQALDIPENYEDIASKAEKIRIAMKEGRQLVLKDLETAQLHEDQLCQICFTNKISHDKMAANAINANDDEEEYDPGERSTARTFNDGQTFEFTKACGHCTCIPCATRIFKDRIYNSHGLVPFEMPCAFPDCQETIPDHAFLSFLGEHGESKTVERIKELREDYKIEQDALQVWCIQSGCGGVVRLSYQNMKQVECNKCRETMCAICLRDGHGDSYCEE